MPNVKNAIRESLLAKLAVYLVHTSRDLGLYKTLPRSEGRLFMTHAGTKYAIVPRTARQEYFTPGVNVVFLDEVDYSAGRTTNKRWLLPFVIRIVKPIASGRDPMVDSFEVSDLMQRVLETLSDQAVEIYDFGANIRLGRGTWHKDSGYILADESLPVEGGDTRLALTVYVTYVEAACGE